MASKLSIRRAQVHVPVTCALCDSIEAVNWFCNDCQEVMCDKCKEVHQRGKKTRNDDVVPIKQADTQGEVILPEICKTHPGKTLDLFCKECHVVMCSMCFTQTHKQHTVGHIEEEMESQKQYVRDQLETLKSKLDYFKDHRSKRHEASKTFRESLDVVRKDVQAQGSMLKAEIDSIVTSILMELSSLAAEEDESCKQDCQPDEKHVTDITQLIRDVEQKTEQKSSTALFELTGRLRNTVPLYDVTGKSVPPRPPSLVTGQLDTKQLKEMVGYVSARYEKNEVDSRHVQNLSTFRIPQQNTIISICSTEDSHAWISVHESTDLIKVNKKGNVTESVKLDFVPWCLTMTNTDELLITSRGGGLPLIHKLSKDRRVTRFADISPLVARGISVSDSDEVFVTTGTTTIQVLNMSGERIRQISVGRIGIRVVCLTAGNFAVATGDGSYCKELVTVNKSDKIIHKWSGGLDNGQKLEKTMQSNIARDRYDRVFVPDYQTNQVYVLSGNERKAKCLLDKKHGVTNPLAVCVDRCGHVWIGCEAGTVHVMEL